MVELTDSEAKRVIQAVEKVQVKHMDGSDITGEKLGRLANELEGRINDLGFGCIVDVTPLWGGKPVVVSITERHDGRDSIGVEQKMFEVRKRAEKKEHVPDIEGHV
jgi:hypothetical protein